MAFALTIAGATKQLKERSLQIPLTANGRATASFSVVSTDGTYRPAMDAEVIMTEGGTRIFGGLVSRPREVGAMGTGASPGIITHVSAVDFNVYPERRFAKLTIPAGTLEDALNAILPYLTGYGVTLHGSQVTGPALPELVYDYRRLDEVLNEFATITAQYGEPYVWDIDHFKVLRMYQPSTVAAPFDITTNTPAEVIGDIEVEVNRDAYANRIIVKVPPQTEQGRTESWTYGTDPYPFQLQYTPTQHYGHLTLSTGGGELMGVVGTTPTQWELDTTTNTLTRTAGTPTGGTVYSMYFDGVFSGLGIAEDAAEIAAHGVKERVIVVESIPSDTTAQAIAEGYLAKSIYEQRTVSYYTHEAGVAPGQTQTITVSRRNLNVTAVITGVTISDYVTEIVSGSPVHVLRRRVTAIADGSQTNLGRDFREELKLWRGDKAGGSAPEPVVSAPSPSGPGAPFTSVQCNRSGTFGGDASFHYYDGTGSVVCGPGSEITAASHEGCAIFGKNCAITD